MIRYLEGNILDDDAEALVNPVNCVGVMGAGLAKQFRERFSYLNRRYRDACLGGALKPGDVVLCDTYLEAAPYWVVCFATKDHWRNPSRPEWIIDGLSNLQILVLQYRLRSIAIPMLGCGLGGLDWAEVRPLIERAFADLPDVDVRVYGPPA